MKKAESTLSLKYLKKNWKNQTVMDDFEWGEKVQKYIAEENKVKGQKYETTRSHQTP